REVRITIPRSGGERKDRVTVTHRVRWIDGAREAIVGHRCHAVDVGLRQPGVGGDHADCRILAGPWLWPAHESARAQQRPHVGEAFAVLGANTGATRPGSGSTMSPTALTAAIAAHPRPVH